MQNVNTRELSIMKQSQGKIAMQMAEMHNIQLTLKEYLRLTDLLIDMCQLPSDDPELQKRMKAADGWIAKKKSNV